MNYNPAILTGVLNVVLAFAGVGVLWSIWRKPTFARIVAGFAVLGMIGFGLAVIAGVLRDLFYSMRILAYFLFGQGPALLLGVAFVTWRPLRWMAAAAIFCSIGILVVAVDVFWIEPTALEINEYTLRSNKIDRPIKVVIIADLQTELISDYERTALRKAIEQKGDLVLFAGDYLQEDDPEKAKRLREDFDVLLAEMKITAPMGVFAIRGNTEWDGWEASFDRLGYRTFEQSDSIDLGDLVLTGLSEADSFDPQCPDYGKSLDPEKFHLVLGHSPDCILGDPTADVVVCGHTHGGQVRLPGIGPLLTMSRIPRRWAAGMNAIDANTTLLVSRGIGHECCDAPRLRFFCHPEIVVLQLLPQSAR